MIAGQEADLAAGYAHFVGDLGGDGGTDVLVAARLGSAGDGDQVWLFQQPEGSWVLPGDAAATLRDDEGGELESADGVGDLDGDGHSEVAFSTSSGLGIFSGPLVGSSSMAAADAQLPAPCGSCGLQAIGPGDMDGDGQDDLVIAVSDWDLDIQPRVLILTDVPGGQLTELAAIARIDGEPGQDFSLTVCRADDVDGDGLGDLLIGSPWRSDPREQSGATFLALSPPSGTRLTTGLDLTIRGRESFGAAGFPATAGDLDGDGRAEVLLGAPSRSRFNHGQGFLFYASGL